MEAFQQKSLIPNSEKKSKILKWYKNIPSRELITEINLILVGNGRSIRVHHLLQKEIIKLFEIFGKPDCFTTEAYENYLKSYETIKTNTHVSN